MFAAAKPVQRVFTAPTIKYRSLQSHTTGYIAAGDNVFTVKLDFFSKNKKAGLRTDVNDIIPTDLRHDGSVFHPYRK